MGLRSISQILGTLILIAIVIGASLFVAWLLLGTVSVFKQSTTLNVVGGEAYIDPSDPTSRTAFGDVSVSIIGPDIVNIRNITVTYGGREYSTTCLNCGSVITSNFPNSANDVVTLRFYFRSNTQVSVGSRILVRITYTAGRDTKNAIGSIYVVS